MEICRGASWHQNRRSTWRDPRASRSTSSYSGGKLFKNHSLDHCMLLFLLLLLLLLLFLLLLLLLFLYLYLVLCCGLLFTIEGE